MKNQKSQRKSRVFGVKQKRFEYSKDKWVNTGFTGFYQSHYSLQLLAFIKPC